MKIKFLHILHMLNIVIAASMLLVAAAPRASAQVLTGKFVDAPVEGLTFVSGLQSGMTDAGGAFLFEANGMVQFQVGNVVLGQAPAKPLMTPIDLVQAVDPAAGPTDPRVIQIVQFLMTVNANPPAAASMLVSAFAATNAATVPAVDLSSGLVDLVPILGIIVPAKTVVPAAVASAHLQASLAALVAPKAGVFTGLDSTLNPTLGLRLVITSNLVGNGFDVAGIAVHSDGATWTVSGTMTLDGALQAIGTGDGTLPPAAMTITGAVASATQLSATASFTLNALTRQVPIVLERAVPTAAAGKLALGADPGVTNATQTQHFAASLEIMADGQVGANIVEGEITGLPLAPVMGGRFVRLMGVMTSAGMIMAIGGGPGAGETTVSRSSTPPASTAFLTGKANPDGTISANVSAQDITGGGAVVPPLGFVAATNPLIGVFVGTHSDEAPNPPGTVALGVNNDGSVHGYTRFMMPGKRFPETDDLIDGVVDAGGVLGVPPGFPIGELGALGIPPAAPGLVMTDDEGTNFGAFVGVFAGTVDGATGTASGNWMTGPGVPVTGTFTTTLLP